MVNIDVDGTISEPKSPTNLQDNKLLRKNRHGRSDPGKSGFVVSQPGRSRLIRAEVSETTSDERPTTDVDDAEVLTQAFIAKVDQTTRLQGGVKDPNVPRVYEIGANERDSLLETWRAFHEQWTKQMTFRVLYDQNTSAEHMVEQPDTVIVVPTNHKEMTTVESILSLWNSLDVCTKEKGPVADLVFVASVHHEDLKFLQEAEARLPGVALSNCFRKITYAMSNLPSAYDTYPAGPSHVFLWMMSEFTHQGYKYIIQHELDVHPVKEHWLSTIVDEAKQFDRVQPKPWVIGPGAVYTDGRKEMNGNSIYVNDPDFLKFLDRFEKKMTKPSFSFDIEMSHFLRDEGLESDSRFVISPSFVNCCGFTVLECTSTLTAPWPPITCQTALVHVGGRAGHSQTGYVGVDNQLKRFRVDKC
jgi:hypothetical protein